MKLVEIARERGSTATTRRGAMRYLMANLREDNPKTAEGLRNIDANVEQREQYREAAREFLDRHGYMHRRMTRSCASSRNITSGTEMEALRAHGTIASFIRTAKSSIAPKPGAWPWNGAMSRRKWRTSCHKNEHWGARKAPTKIRKGKHLWQCQ